MTEIDVKTEQDVNRGWAFGVQVRDGGRTFDYDVTLSWSDYDHWCRGQSAPSQVVKAIFEFLLLQEPASAILPKFDCSVVRRYFPAIDQELPGLIGRA